MKGIRIVQIYLPVNMNVCKGENSLLAFLKEKKRTVFEAKDVFMFFNNANNIVKAFVPFYSTIVYKKLKGKETWNWELRKEELLNLVGQAFGIKWNVNNAVYEQARKEAQNAEIRAKAKRVVNG